MKEHVRMAWALLLCLAVAVAACPRRGGGGGDGDGDDDDDTVSDGDRQALEGFLAAYPEAFCAWAVECGLISAESESACVSDAEAEIGGVAICDAIVTFYADNRAALDACVGGSPGACSGTDDDFCRTLADYDYEHACDAPPDCTVPADCGDGEDCVDGTCTVTGGDLTTEQAAVGVWSGSGTCDGTPIQVSWFLCPAGRVRGFTIIDGYDFLDCGTWSASGNEISGVIHNTAVIDGSTDSYDYYMQYDGERMYWGGCALPLDRVPGAVDESDCTGGTCSQGGTGDEDCGTDCDCGRCWYCEIDICRYGGEGAYGCYRGCGF